MIPKTILKFLDGAKIKYEPVEHRTVYTALDKARTLRLEPKMVVKTALLKAGPNDFFLTLVAADKLLDTIKLKKIYNDWRKKQGGKPASAIDFAKEAWMKKNIEGKVGATPAFGPFFKIKGKKTNLPVFIDNGLLKQNKLILNAGDYNTSLRLNKANFLKAVGAGAVKGAFGKARK